MSERLCFRAFRAIEEPETCEKFLNGHVAVLKDYGITNITTNNSEWMKNPNIYGIVAEIYPDMEIVGGIRVQISDEQNWLPVEKAISKMDPKIHDIVKKYRENGGVGELCALWNAKRVAGIGISILLTRAGISMANQLDFGTLVGICAEYTLEMFRRVGFVVDDSLGMNGEFQYPNENYIARVLGIMNAATLSTADEYDKMRMESLRLFPEQLTVEQGTKEKIEIQYQLTLPNYKK
ncbi:MAG: hypothetical protein HUU47_04660 [Bacteroidetes bacterium]|nr:hypothetical protein [Bacteroidota bacterium]